MKKLFFLFAFTAIFGSASYGAYFYDNPEGGWNQWGDGSRSEIFSEYLTQGIYLWTEVAGPDGGTAVASSLLYFNNKLKVYQEQDKRGYNPVEDYYNFGYGTYKIVWRTKISNASSSVSAAVGVDIYEIL